MAKPILLYDIITDELIEEITEQLIECNQNEPVELWLNSPGGSVAAGWSLIAALHKQNAPVNMTVMGDASSMGFFLLLFADKVTAYDSANFLIHRAASFWESIMNDEELYDIETRNNLLRAKLTARIDEKKFIEVTGKSFDDIFNMKTRLDVRLNAIQAKEIGLVNELIVLDVAQKRAIESRYFADIAALATPTHATNKININMSKLTDLIFGEKDSVLVAKIGESQFVYSKLEKGAKIKAIGKDTQPISGTSEAENKCVSVVENEITAIVEIDSTKKEMEILKAELDALKASQITAEDIAEVVLKLQEKNATEIEALKAGFNKAKISVSTAKVPEGEFKNEISTPVRNTAYEVKKEIEARAAERMAIRNNEINGRI